MTMQALTHGFKPAPFFTGQNVEFISHPLYSPDLAPNDFSLFPHIKKQMQGQRFSSLEDIVVVFKDHVLEVSQSEWKKPTQMMVVHQNILGTIMLKNDKLFHGNIRFQLAIPEIC